MFLLLSKGIKLSEGKYSVSLVYDTRTEVDSNWVGVVLRHIPSGPDTVGDIQNTFSAHLEKAGFKDFKVNSNEIIVPHKVQNKLCTVVEIRAGIQAAESLCRRWNGTHAKGECLKCHIHPFSCLDRCGDTHPIYTPLFREQHRPCTSGHTFSIPLSSRQVTSTESEQKKREVKFGSKGGQFSPQPPEEDSFKKQRKE